MLCYAKSLQLCPTLCETRGESQRCGHVDGLFGELEDGLKERDGDNQESPEFEHLKSGETIHSNSPEPARHKNTLFCFVNLSEHNSAEPQHSDVTVLGDEPLPR